METSNYKNIQYDTYKNTKNVLSTIRKQHEDKLKHHLISQGSFFSNVIIVSVTGDTLRPDLVLTIENKCIYILELTVGFESNLLHNARRKREKYQDLVNEQLKKYEKAQFVNVSISSLGVLSETSLSLIEVLKDLEFDEACRKYLVRKIINTCIRSTYYIFCKRNKVWDNPELMSY